MIKIGLDDVNVLELRGVLPRHLDRGTEIDGPNFARVLSGVVSKTPAAATRVQNFLAFEKLRPVRLHVVEKLFLPLVIHLVEAAPLVTKAQRRLRLLRVERARAVVLLKRRADSRQ